MMLKAININQPTKFVIMKDGNKISEIFVSKAQGFIDTDGFKRVETLQDPMNCELIVKVEV